MPRFLLGLVVVASLALAQACDDRISPVTADATPPDRAVPDRPIADARPDSGADARADLPRADVRVLDAPGADLPRADAKPPLDTVKVDSSVVAASLDDEKWYQGSVQCTAAAMLLSEMNGDLVVHLNQIPAAEVPGTCSGHLASAKLTGSTIDLDLTKTGGGACWTACWDFVITIKNLAKGTYKVVFHQLSNTITI